MLTREELELVAESARQWPLHVNPDAWFVHPNSRMIRNTDTAVARAMKTCRHG